MSEGSTGQSIRILMLHGYAQSGRFFEIKTRPFIKRLIKILSAHYNTQENNIQLVYPDGPIQLDERGGGAYEAGVTGSGIYGWTSFYDAGATVQYKGLERSLALLKFITEIQGPFSGVVGFSQGAAVAAIFASWCETDFTLGRRQALQDMGKHLHPALSRLLFTSPQRPLDFAIFCSGFRANTEFYPGFYDPPLTTPSVHVLGELDTFIPRSNSLELFDSCLGPVLVEHQGVHYVPRDTITVEKIMQSVLMLLWLKSPRLSPGPHDNGGPPDTQVLNQPRETLMTLSLRLHSCSTPYEAASPTSSESSLDTSSLSTHGSRRPRIVRRYRLPSSSGSR